MYLHGTKYTNTTIPTAGSVAVGVSCSSKRDPRPPPLKSLKITQNSSSFLKLSFPMRRCSRRLPGFPIGIFRVPDPRSTKCFVAPISLFLEQVSVLGTAVPPARCGQVGRVSATAHGGGRGRWRGGGCLLPMDAGKRHHGYRLR